MEYLSLVSLYKQIQYLLLQDNSPNGLARYKRSSLFVHTINKLEYVSLWNFFWRLWDLQKRFCKAKTLWLICLTFAGNKHQELTQEGSIWKVLQLGWLWPCSQILRLTGKCFQGQTLKLICPDHQRRRKNVLLWYWDQMNGVLVAPQVVDLRLDLQRQVLVDGEGVRAVSDLQSQTSNL